MHNLSYWERKYFWKRQNFTIIGSGITGLTSAYYLKRKFPKSSVSILERGFLPSGASTKNAGFACFGSISEILDDFGLMGEDKTLSLIERRIAGLDALRELLGDENLHYEHSGGYELFTNSENELYRTCVKQVDHINDLMSNTIGKQCFESADEKIAEFGFRGVDHIIFNRHEGMIDTGLMMKNLTRKVLELGIDIHTNTEVLKWDEDDSKVVIQTNHGDLITNQLIVATNGFTRTLVSDIDVKPARAQVLVTTPIESLKVKGTFHHHKGFDYFRNIDGRILLGGGRHLAMDDEETTEMATSEKIQSYLEELLKSVILPNTPYEIEQQWSGIMGVGKSKDVILKNTSSRVTLAVRLGGMGVALGTQIGREVSSRF